MLLILGKFFDTMLLRRTAGLLTSLLLLQSILVAAGGVGCMPENKGLHATLSAMNHSTMRGGPAAIPVHSTVSSVLAEQMSGESASDHEAASCVLMNSCTSSSEVALAYIAAPLRQSIPSHIVLSASAPRSRGTTPDVPPPRT